MSEIKVLDARHLTHAVGVVVGTRPGVVMFAPIIHALRAAGVPHFIVHTGQHYSPNMDAQFFDDLRLPAPDHRIEGTSGRSTHGAQTAIMLEGIESILLQEKPALVLVGGDANTNLAGALAARKLRIAVGHVESGERSFDWRMPEEHNRRMIDHISDLLFVTNDKGKAQLEREAVQGTIIVSGNPIVDASIRHLEIAERKSEIFRRLGIQSPYALMTSHREENVDFEPNLRGSLLGASRCAQELDLPVHLMLHPRTHKRIREFGLETWLHELPGVFVHEAVGYLDFLALLARARLVLTDSGGVQQEACIHHVPTVTLRENTEWTETLECGANRLAGTDPERILSGARDALRRERDWEVPFGDGRSAQRIVDTCKAFLAERTASSSAR